MIEDDLHLLPGAVAAPRRRVPPRHVLLTGATGFVGSHVLARLLAHGDAEVRCLVRAEDAAAGLARLRGALSGFGLPTAGLAERVVVEPGRIDAPLLGLAPARWAALAGQVDGIVHGAAMLHFLHGYAALRPHNVDATRSVLRLAAESGARLLHLSTINAALTVEEDGRDAVLENDPPPPFAALAGAYNQTKWVGERLVEMAAAAGVDAAILRLGWVIGDVRRGLVAEDQVQHRIGDASVAAGLALLPRGAMDLVPVDYVAELIVALLRDAATAGTYHLVHPVPLDAASMTDAITAAWPGIRPVPIADWVAAMRVRARADPDHPLRALLLLRRPITGIAELLSRMPAFDSRRAAAVAAAHGIAPPETGVEHLARMLGAPQAA